VRSAGPKPRAALSNAYFSELLTELNMVFRLLPRPLTAARMAIEMPAAIRPYSIAVAPDSSDKNFKRAFFKPASWGCVVKPRKITDGASKVE
jgi:hypothetical protein